MTALQRVALALLTLRILVGCGAPGTHVRAVTVGTQTGTDAQGNPIFQDGQDLFIDLSGFAGEFAVWDNYQKRVIAGSAKDEGLDHLDMAFTFGEDGTMLTAHVQIDGRTANSSVPTSAAWRGYTESLRAFGEYLTELRKAVEGVMSGGASGFLDDGDE